MIDAATIEKEALGLDVKARGRLFARLLESLGIRDGIEPLYEGHFDPRLWEKLERRSREWDDDPNIGRPADEAIVDIRHRLSIK